MQIKTQEDLIYAAWINCNRISCLGNVSLYYISHGEGQQIPAFFTRLFNKFFTGPGEYNSFFAEVNRINNWPKFINMLNDTGGFTVNDIILGPLTRKQNIESIPVTEYNYE